MTLKEREQEFIKLVLEYQGVYSDLLLQDFTEYWTECNYKGRKMRFEKEKTFDIKRRLSRWYKNSQKWSKESKPLSLAEKMRKQYGIE
jgi:hypothetical protein